MAEDAHQREEGGHLRRHRGSNGALRVAGPGKVAAARRGAADARPEVEAEQLNTTHRQMQQGAAGSCDASGVCTARIITRTVVMQPAMSAGGGGGGSPERSARAICSV